MFDDEFGAARMTDEWSHSRVVHGVGQVSYQHHPESEPSHLPDSERAVEYTDVSVNAHQGHVGDAFLLKEIVDLLPVLADTVKPRDVDGRVAW